MVVVPKNAKELSERNAYRAKSMAKLFTMFHNAVFYGIIAAIIVILFINSCFFWLGVLGILVCCFRAYKETLRGIKRVDEL